MKVEDLNKQIKKAYDKYVFFNSLTTLFFWSFMLITGIGLTSATTGNYRLARISMVVVIFIFIIAMVISYIARSYKKKRDRLEAERDLQLWLKQNPYFKKDG